MKNVATIIVTYNGAQWIEKCLQHLLESSLQTTIIIVDNYSTDNTIDLLKPYLDHITLMQMDQNLGFGAANNIAIEKVLGLNIDYAFLLNQDAYVSKNCIENLVKVSKGNPEFGILSPMQFSEEGIALDATFKNQLSRSIHDIPKTSFGNDEELNELVAPMEVRFVGAAAWFLNVEILRKVGFFHPAFYHYGEDNNYAARVQYHGQRIGVVTQSSVIHDRAQRTDPVRFLPVKLRSFPLHLLLDVRKTLPIAWLAGFYQLYRIRRKLKKSFGVQYEMQFFEMKRWFFEKMNEVIKIRRSFKVSNAANGN